MKTQKTILSFLSGLVLGVLLVMGFGVSGQYQTPTPPARTNWSNLIVTGYPSGTTGILDPATGRLYLYDVFGSCFAIRQITELGEPMRRLR